MYKSFYYLDEKYKKLLKEEFIIEKSFSSRSEFYSLYDSNNDTLDIILNVSIYLKFYIFSFYELLLSYIFSLKNKIYKIEFIFVILSLLFSCVLTFDNSDISSNLIINAYFPRNKLTRLSYNMLKDKKIDNTNNVKKKSKENIINKYININEENNIFSKQKKIKSNGCDYYDNEKYYPHHKDYSNNNLISNQNDDIYIFFFIPLKSSIFSLISFLILYTFIKLTLTSKVRSYFLFNLFCSLIVYYVIYAFYESKYYLSSNFFFILFIYIEKCLIDSLYLLFKFKRKDFEIFSTNLIAFDIKQFLLKFIILFGGAMTSGFLSVLFFQSCINYIVFYLCFLTLMVFLCNCLEPVAPYYMKPMKNVLMFLVGIWNFYVSKKNSTSDNFIDPVFDLHTLNNTKNLNLKVDSFYFISDCFTMFCFDYINGYIEYQMEDFFSPNKTINEKCDENIKKYKKAKKNVKTIKQKELFFMILFFLSISLGITGVCKGEYMSFILSVYLSKIILFYCLRVYDMKISRLINSVIEMIYLLIFIQLSNKDDIYLASLISTLLSGEKFVFIFIIKIVSLLLFAYFFVLINIILYFTTNPFKEENEKEVKELPKEHVEKILQMSNLNMEKLKNYNFKIINGNVNKNKKYKLSNMLFITLDCSFNFFNLSLIFIIIEYYEKSFILKLIYCLLSLVLQIVKIFIINQIKSDVEFLFGFFITFILSLRLLRLSVLNENILLYILNHLCLNLLITYYSINPKKHIFITIIIILHLILEFLKFKSYFIILDVFSLFISPILKQFHIYNFTKIDSEENLNKNNDKKGGVSMNYSLLLLIPLVLFFFVQLGLQNYSNFVNELYLNFKELMIDMKIIPPDGENDSRSEVVDYKHQIEYYIINEIIKWIKKSK